MALQTLVPIEIGPQQLGQALTHDLFSLQGVLLARAGSVIQNPQRLAQLAGQRLYRPSTQEDARDEENHPVHALKNLGLAYSALLDAHPVPPPDAIRVLAEDLQRFTGQHPEMCVALAPRIELASLSRRHALFTAVVGLLLARRIGMDEAAGLTIACAALTMNLTSQRLQDALSHVAEGPDDDQRSRLLNHPVLSAEALKRVGVTDPAWLLAVRQHHENLDGSGYPLGLAGTQIIPEARVLRVADVWCALLSHRHIRVARYPRQAQHSVFHRERRRLDDALLLALRNFMGHYPPGTLVRLANRETALVTQWFEGKAQPPLVVSILRPSGDPLARPQVRSTGRNQHAIRDYTWLPIKHVPLDWVRIWSAR